MKIERFEDIEARPPRLSESDGGQAWQPVESLQVERLARELACKVYGLTKKAKFAHDFGLKGQIQDAAGSSMHNTRPVKCLRM